MVAGAATATFCVNNPFALWSAQVMIDAASREEQKTPEYRTRKLESLTRQNELIEEENRKREEAKQAQVGRSRRVLNFRLQYSRCNFCFWYIFG